MTRSVGLALALVFLLQPAVMALVGSGPAEELPGSGPDLAPGPAAAASSTNPEPENPQSGSIPPGFGALCFRAVNHLRDDRAAGGATAAPAPEILVVAKPARSAPLSLLDDLLLNTPSNALVTDGAGATPAWPLPPGPAVVAAVDPWGWYRPLLAGVQVRPAGAQGCDTIELRMVPAARPLPLTVPSLAYNGNDLVRGLGATTPGYTLTRDPRELGPLGPVPAPGPLVPSVEREVCILPATDPVPLPTGAAAVHGIKPVSPSCIRYKDSTACVLISDRTPGSAPITTPWPQLIQSGIPAVVYPARPLAAELTGNPDVCRKEPDEEGEVGYLRGRVVDGSVLGQAAPPIPGISVALQVVAQANSPVDVNLNLRNIAAIASQNNQQVMGLVDALQLGQVPLPSVGGAVTVDPSGTGVPVGTPAGTPLAPERVPDDANSLPLVAVRRGYEALAPPAAANLGDHRDDRYRYRDHTDAAGQFVVACHRLGDAGRGNSLSLALLHPAPDGRSLWSATAHPVVPATGDCVPGKVTDLGTLRLERTGIVNTGAVLHATTQAAVGGADVTATNPAGRVAAQPPATKTTANGTYALKVPWTGPAEGDFALRWSKQGFQDATATEQVGPHQVPRNKFPEAAPGARALTETGLQVAPTVAGIADERLLNALVVARNSAYQSALNQLAAQPTGERNLCEGVTTSACQSYQQAVKATFDTGKSLGQTLEQLTLVALDAGVAACRVAGDRVGTLGPDLGLDDDPSTAPLGAAIAPHTTPVFQATPDQRADAASALDACDRLLRARLLAAAPALDALERALVGRYLDRLAGELGPADQAYRQQLAAALAALDTALAAVPCPAQANLGPPVDLATCRAAADLAALARARVAASAAARDPSQNLAEARTLLSQSQAQALAALDAACAGHRDAAPACAAALGGVRLAVAAAYADAQGLLDRASLAAQATAASQKALTRFLASETDLRVAPWLDLAQARGPAMRGAVLALMADPQAAPAIQQLRAVAVLLEGGDPAAVLLATAAHGAANRDVLAPLAETGEAHDALARKVAPQQAAALAALNQAFADFGVRVRDVELRPEKQLRRVVDLAGLPIPGAQVCLAPPAGPEDCAYLTDPEGYLTHPALPGLRRVVEPGTYDVRITGPGGAWAPRTCAAIEVPVVRLADPDDLQHTCWVLLRAGHAGLVVKAYDRLLPARTDTENRETGPCGATIAARVGAGPEALGLTACATAAVGSYREALGLGLARFTNGTGAVEVPVDPAGSAVTVQVRYPGYYQDSATVAVAGVLPGTITDVLEHQPRPLDRATAALHAAPLGQVPRHAALVTGATVKVSEATWMRNAAGLPREDLCAEGGASYDCGARFWTNDPWGLGWPVGGPYKLTFVKTTDLLYSQLQRNLATVHAPVADLPSLKFPVAHSPVSPRHGKVVDAHNDAGIPVPVQVTRGGSPGCDDTVPEYDCATTSGADGKFTLMVPDFDGMANWRLLVNPALQGYNTTNQSLTQLTSAAPGAEPTVKLSRTVKETIVKVVDRITGNILAGVPVSLALDGGASRCAVPEDVGIACSNVSRPNGNAHLWIPWGAYQLTGEPVRRSLRYDAVLDAPGLPGAAVLVARPFPVYDDANFTRSTAASGRDRTQDTPPQITLPMDRLARPLAGTVAGPGNPGAPLAQAQVRAHPLIRPAANWDPAAACAPACTGLTADAAGRFASTVPDLNYRLAAPITKEETLAALAVVTALHQPYSDAHDRLDAGAPAVGGARGLTANLTFLSRLPEVWQVSARAAGHADGQAYAVYASPAEAPFCDAGPLDDRCAPLQQPLAQCTHQALPDEVPALVSVCPQHAVDLVLSLLPKTARTTFVVTRGAAFGAAVPFDQALVCISQPANVASAPPDRVALELQKALLLEHLTDVPLLQVVHDRLDPGARSDCRRTDGQGRVHFDLTPKFAQPALGQVQSENDAIVFVERDVVKGTPPWIESFRVKSEDQVVTVEVVQPFPLEVPNSCSPSPAAGSPEACINAPEEGTPRTLTAVLVDEATRNVLGPAPGAWFVKGPDLAAPPVIKPGSAGLSQLDLQAENAGTHGDGTWTVVLAPNAAPPRTLVRLTYVADGLPACTSPDLRMYPRQLTTMVPDPAVEGAATWVFTVTAATGCETAAVAFEPDVEPDGSGLRFHLGGGA